MAEYTNIDPNNPPAPQTKKIWVTFLILVGITGIEFLFAFLWKPIVGEGRKEILITIYILLTLCKAYFIVSEFMHLGHEVKGLVYSVVMPMIFVCWLVGALIWEAKHYYDSSYSFEDTWIQKKEVVKEAPEDSGEK